MRFRHRLSRAARPWCALFAAVPALLLTACPAGDSGGGTTEPVPDPIARVVVTPSPVTLDVGATRMLAATLYGASGATLTGRAVRYTTSDAAIATVDGGGTVVAVSPGRAAITVASAEAPSVSARAEVSVRAPQVTLTVARSGTGSGTVASAPGGIECPATCAAPFAVGASVVLTASPSAGSTFAGWTGACSGATTTCTVTLRAAETVTARFEALYDLRVAFAGTGAGRVKSVEAALDCAVACSASVVSGAVVTLSAVADAASTFGGWSGACTGAGVTCTVTLDAARAVTATFSVVVPTYTLGVSVSGTGSVASTPAGIACPSACTGTFESGTVVTLTAVPGAGQTFSGWSGACAGTVATCSVTMSGVRAATATFAAAPAARFPLGVTVGGAGFGSVVSSPVGISCPGACSATFDAGTAVTLTTTPNAASTFGGWAGACVGTAPSCVVTMTSGKQVAAAFDASATTMTTLNVTLLGNGAGHVTSLPAGLDCPATCSGQFANGARVTLTAVADVRSATAQGTPRLTGWGGECSGTAPTCTVEMTRARNVSATFTDFSTVSVGGYGDGRGRTTSMPTGIDCPTTCRADFPRGTQVTLTATPEPGSYFESWGPNPPCTGTAPTCTFEVAGAPLITANFSSTYGLRLGLAGTPAATVTSSPAGINCGGYCFKRFPVNSTVVLTAAVDPTIATFYGWSGDCTGTAPTCTVVMSGNKQVTAWTLGLMTTLDVTMAGSGAGTVRGTTQSIAGNLIECPTRCHGFYSLTLTETLTALPAPGSTFVGWSGACTGTGTCVLPMSSSRIVTATFATQGGLRDPVGSVTPVRGP